MRLRIEDMAYGGAGVARAVDSKDAGSKVFVPFTLPGEVVEVRHAPDQGGEREASLLQVLTRSISRVQPECVHFGECGGCQYQHAAYPAQLEIKSAILHGILERAGMTALPAIQVHASTPWNYRNRSRLRVERHDGALRVGYNRRGSNEFLPIRECPISAPLIARAWKALLHVGAEDSASARWAQHVAEVEFFVSDDEKKLQMTLSVRKDSPGFDRFCARMSELIPELAGAGTVQLPPAGQQRRIQRPRPLSAWKAPGLSYRVAGEDYWISRGGFFQVNRFLLEELVAIVTRGRRGLVAWDLYAGVGLFSRALARSFEQVVAVETSAGDLTRTFKAPGRRAVEATTAEFLRNAVVQRERPELIVMDPPRAGVGEEVCALLARIAASEIVYVSCEPMTLARDLKLLTEAGYAVTDLRMIDLFPQTYHLETVVVLRRGS